MRPLRPLHVTLVLTLAPLAACSGAPSESIGGSEAAIHVAHATPLTTAQHHRADQLVSVFENGTIDIQYDYVEDIHDGRGYTAGRGFTTATGDVLTVVKDYLKSVPGDPLAQLLPELEAVAQSESGDTSGLTAFPQAWKAAAQTPEMRAAEDREVSRTSFQPAMVRAHNLGLTTVLARVALYDAIVMHGDGDDADGLPALITRANQRAGGTPASGINEHTWLRAFLKVRRADVAHASDPGTRAAWAEAVGRVDVFSDLLAAGNDDLHGPIRVRRGYDVTVP